MVLPVVRAAALGAHQRAVGHGERELEHRPGAVGGHQLGVGAGAGAAQADVAAAAQQFLQLVDRLLQHGAVAEDADPGGHDLLHAPLDGAGVLAAAHLHDGVEPRLLALQEVAHHAGRDRRVVAARVAEVGDELADDHAGHHGLGHRVAAQPVEAVHVPAGRLAGGKQARQGGALAGVAGAHAAHGVVLRRPHRDQVPHRVEPEEVAADVVDLAQVVLDVLLAQQRDVEQQVLAEAGLHALAARDVLLHAAADHVAAGELLLLGLVVGHEARSPCRCRRRSPRWWSPGRAGRRRR